jgi:hypothetical protein
VVVSINEAPSGSLRLPDQNYCEYVRLQQGIITSEMVNFNRVYKTRAKLSAHWCNVIDVAMHCCKQCFRKQTPNHSRWLSGWTCWESVPNIRHVWKKHSSFLPGFIIDWATFFVNSYTATHAVCIRRHNMQLLPGVRHWGEIPIISWLSKIGSLPDYLMCNFVTIQ